MLKKSLSRICIVYNSFKDKTTFLKGHWVKTEVSCEPLSCCIIFVPWQINFNLLVLMSEYFGRWHGSLCEQHPWCFEFVGETCPCLSRTPQGHFGEGPFNEVLTEWVVGCGVWCGEWRVWDGVSSGRSIFNINQILARPVSRMSRS